MTATIVQNDGGGPVTGTIDNGTLSATVNVSNFDNTGVLGWLWELVYRPPGSSAAIAAPNASATSFVPDVRGTYLIRLTTYTDAARTIKDDADEQCYGIRLETPFDWRVPAAGETSQFDTDAGWALARNESIRDVHAFMNGGMPQLLGVVNATMDGADPEEVFGGFVLDGSNFPNNALKLRIVGRITVAGAGTGELRIYDLGAPGTPIVPVLRSTSTIENGAAGDVVVRDQTLTPVASPGVGANEIHTARRIYEIRAVMVGAAGGDSLKIHNGGVVLEA